MVTGPLRTATCMMGKFVSELCWQSDDTVRQNLFFITVISVYITKMLLMAIKRALSGSLKNPALVFDWLTSERLDSPCSFSMMSDIARFGSFQMHLAHHLCY